MKCPCCKGFGKLNVPPRPAEVKITSPSLESFQEHHKGDCVPIDWRITAMEDNIRYLMRTVEYLTAMIENPACPHCNGTGEVQDAEVQK